MTRDCTNRCHNKHLLIRSDVPTPTSNRGKTAVARPFYCRRCTHAKPWNDAQRRVVTRCHITQNHADYTTQINNTNKQWTNQLRAKNVRHSSGIPTAAANRRHTACMRAFRRQVIDRCIHHSCRDRQIDADAVRHHTPNTP